MTPVGMATIRSGQRVTNSNSALTNWYGKLVSMDQALEKTHEAIERLKDVTQNSLGRLSTDLVRLESKVDTLANSISDSNRGHITDRVRDLEYRLTAADEDRRRLRTDFDAYRANQVRISEKWQDRWAQAAIRWAPTIASLIAAGYIATRG